MPNLFKSVEYSKKKVAYLQFTLYHSGRRRVKTSSYRYKTKLNILFEILFRGTEFHVINMHALIL